jgi:hypothetical protein
MIVANPIYDVVFKYLMEDEHMLRIDEANYADDKEMEHILHRLTAAAADAEVRHHMNVEDEYYSVIEKRDTEILMKDKQLAEKNVLLAEKDEQIVRLVKALYQYGKDEATIAEMANIDIDTVRRLL